MFSYFFIFTILYITYLLFLVIASIFGFVSVTIADGAQG